MENEIFKFFGRVAREVAQLRQLSSEASRLAALVADADAPVEKRATILEALATPDDSLRGSSNVLFKQNFPGLFPVIHKLDKLATERK